MEELKNNSTAQEFSKDLYEVVFTPIMNRSAYQGEPIYSKLIALRDAMGEKEFNEYINSLIRITYKENTLWLITRKEMHRTIIEGKYLALIKDIFEVTYIRVFSQA